MTQKEHIEKLLERVTNMETENDLLYDRLLVQQNRIRDLQEQIDLIVQIVLPTNYGHGIKRVTLIDQLVSKLKRGMHR